MRDLIDIVEDYNTLLEKAGPLTLIGFIVRNGGVKDVGGNLKSMGMNRIPGLVRPNGVPLDRMREKAAEAGYLGADTEDAVANTDINDLLNAIEDAPRFSVYDQEEIERKKNRPARSEVRAHAQAVSSLVAHYQGEHLDPHLLDIAAWKIVREGVPIEHAYEDARDEEEKARCQAQQAYMPDLDGIEAF